MPPPRKPRAPKGARPAHRIVPPATAPGAPTRAELLAALERLTAAEHIHPNDFSRRAFTHARALLAREKESGNA